MQLICIDEQFFPDIRAKNGIYVDKTRAIYDCFKGGKYFFISRPRRFGKSLLCSTVAELFAGNRAIFKGLWIDQSDWEWEENPVIYFDMTKVSSPVNEAVDVKNGLMILLRSFAAKYAIHDLQETTPDQYFADLVKKIFEKTNKRVVVIIDEYDKPLLDLVEYVERYRQVQEILRGLYGQLKACSEYLRFALLTGVFKFAKTSVFSGLNNLRDLTFDPVAATLLGYTTQDVKDYFSEHLVALAKGYKKTTEEMMTVLQERYNGYYFGVNDMTEQVLGGVYNPFALNYVFSQQQLSNKWFLSATPTFLIKKLANYDFQELDPEVLVASFGKLQASNDPGLDGALCLLYYSGYLTLKAYSSQYATVALDFPNAEVSQAFSEQLLPLVAQKPEAGLLVLARRVKEILLKKQHDALSGVLNQALAQLPYHLFGTQESYYQTVFYMLLSAGNCVAVTEDMMNRGRADITVLLPEMVYIFELKMNQSAHVAIEQIKSRAYADKYRHLGRQIYAIGIELSREERVVWDLQIEELKPVSAVSAGLV